MLINDGYKSRKATTEVDAIHGDYPSGCGGTNAYTGLYEATQATNGAFGSICSNDWAMSILETIAEQTMDFSRFILSDLPLDPSTIGSF